MPEYLSAGSIKGSLDMYYSRTEGVRFIKTLNFSRSLRKLLENEETEGSSELVYA